MSVELYHIPYSFRVGQKVRLVADVKEANAWHQDYTPSSSVLVGQVAKIIKESALEGFMCQAGNLAYWFPSCALEGLFDKQGPCIIEVPSV